MNKITHYFLYKNDACADQRKLFRELYPNGIAVCWKCLKKAQSQGLEVYWLNRFVQDLYVRNQICNCWDYRSFPKLAKRFKFASWDIPYITSNKTFKLLEQELLKKR